MSSTNSGRLSRQPCQKKSEIARYFTVQGLKRSKRNWVVIRLVGELRYTAVAFVAVVFAPRGDGEADVSSVRLQLN